MRVLIAGLLAGMAATAFAQSEAEELMQIGQEHFDRGDLVIAQEAYKRLSVMGGYPEVVGVGGLASILTAMGRPDDGVAVYREHAAKSGNLEFNAMAAFLLAQQARPDAARQELVPVSKAFRAKGDLNARTVSLMAFTDRRIGELDDALDAARRASEQFRAEGNSRWTVMGRVAAGLLEDLGRDAEASMEYEAQLALAPDDPGTLNDFATYLAVRGKQLNRALEYARRAADARPGNALMLDTLGLVQFKLGKLEDATDTLVRAWRRDPAATGVRTHLAQAVAKGKDRSASVGALLDALRTEPNTENTAEIERLLAVAGR